MPWFHVAVVISIVRTALDTARNMAVFTWCTARKFLHELLHFTIDSITCTNSSRRTAVAAVVTPISASLPIGTVAGHMSGISTNAANDVGSEITLLRTIVFTMSNLTTILASLVFIVTKSTVEGGKFSELIPLELVLAFRNGRSRLDDVVHQFLGFVDFFFSVCHDKTMEIFFLVASVSGVRSTFSFLD